MRSEGLPANQQRDVSEDPAQAQLVQIAKHVGGVASELANVAQRAFGGSCGTHSDAGLRVPREGSGTQAVLRHVPFSAYPFLP